MSESKLPNDLPKKPNVTPKPSVKPVGSPNIPKPNAVKPPVNSGVKPKVRAVDTKRVDIKKDESSEEKKKKRRKWILILLLLLLFLVGVGVAIYFIAQTPPADLKFTVDIQSQVQTTIVDSLDQSITEIKFMPGDPVNATMKIKITNLDGTIDTNKKVFLRFRIDMLVDGNSYSNFFSPNGDDFLDLEGKEKRWYKGDDNYYYYYSRCYGNEEIDTVLGLMFDGERDNNVLNGKQGQMVFIAEILDGTNFSSINDTWNTAPRDWRRNVK